MSSTRSSSGSQHRGDEIDGKESNHKHRHISRGHHRRDDDHRNDKESSSYRCYRSRSPHDEGMEPSTSRSYRQSSKSWVRHRRDDRMEDKKSAFPSIHHHPLRRRRHSSPTSTSSFTQDNLRAVRLKQIQIWPSINSAVYDYLSGVGWDSGSSTMKEVDPTAVHSILISSVVGVDGTDNLVDLNSKPGRRQDEDESRFRKLNDDIEMDLELETDIILRMLQILELRKGMQRSSPLFLGTDQRVHLLDLVVWALEQWKTLSTGGYAWGKHRVIKLFECTFVKISHQIRVDSALSSRLIASSLSLQLLQKMKSIQNRWLAVVGVSLHIPLRLASFNDEGRLVQNLTKAVKEEVHDKMGLPTLKLKSLVYFNSYEKALKQLSNYCKRNSSDDGAISMQGKLIKEMLTLFKSSVALDREHRDHVFFTTIITGYLRKSVFAQSALEFKRAVVWIALGILPHLQEKGTTIRLLNSFQFVIRCAIDAISETDLGRREVTTWRLILETYLKDEDMRFFYHRVQDKAKLEAVGSADVAKNFEYFYPPLTNGEDNLVPFIELLSTPIIPCAKSDLGAGSSSRENQKTPHIEPKVADVKPEFVDFEEESDTNSVCGSIDSDEMEFLKTVVSVSTLSEEEKEIDPWEIREINYDDPNVKWEYDNFEETITIE